MAELCDHVLRIECSLGTLAYVRIACAVHSKLSLCQQKPMFLGRSAYYLIGRLAMDQLVYSDDLFWLTWASPENPMWKFVCKTAAAGLKHLPRKVAMVLAKGTLDFHEEVILL